MIHFIGKNKFGYSKTICGINVESSWGGNMELSAIISPRQDKFEKMQYSFMGQRSNDAR